ncbi:MAG TPA: hypothetical protein VHL99_04090, partial [Candidatus Binatia bacterium]|nr:hypothetical protein [Candidatus Binatia bacterium]
NGDTVKAFVTALHRGMDTHNADLDGARAIIAKYTGLSPEVLKVIALTAFETKLIESDLQPIMDLALRYKLIDKKFPVRDVIAKFVLA